MAENRNEMSSSSSPTTSSSSPMNDSNHTSNMNDSKIMKNNMNSLNAPKYGTPVPNRVFVGGIPTDANENEVKQLFTQFGSVVSVKIITDRAGISRGYGFVTFDSEEDAKRVVEKSDNLLIKNHKLNVSVAIKKQQHFSNDYNSRVVTNGSLIYSPYSMNTSNSLYPEFHGIYSSEGIPLYNFGISPPIMANSGVTSTSSPYPYAYQSSGLFLTPSQPLGPQLTPQFHSSSAPSTYPLVNTSFRLPLNSQNLSQNSMNPFIHLSNNSTPPLTQTSSLPIQVGSVTNPMLSNECTPIMTSAVNTMNTGLSQLSLYQPPVYAISSNIPNSSQSMGCVQNVHHYKGDNGVDMCSDSGALMSPQNAISQQMVELMPIWAQKVSNNRSPQKTAPNRYQYSVKGQQQYNTSTNTSLAGRDRPDRRTNSSYNTSHNRKAVNTSGNRFKPNIGYGSQNSNNMSGPEIECQTVAHNYNSNLNTSALQGLPFVKHYSNNRYHTLPVNQTMLNTCPPPPIPKHNSTGGQTLVPKMVNGVQIYALANYSGGDVDNCCYTTSAGIPLTPPLTPGNHHSVRQSVHK